MDQNPRRFLSLLLLLGCGLVSHRVRAQAPIPGRPPGFVYKPTTGDVPVVLEAWVDPICPDSKDAWLTYQKVADHYGTNMLRFSVLMFPLPYHRAAMIGSQGVFVADELNSTSTFAWLNNVYEKQAALYDDAIYDQTQAFIIDTMATWAEEVGYNKAEFATRLARSDPLQWQTRVEFKYGGTRGVFGTPQTYVNGALVYSSPTWTLDDWKKVIDPLVSDNRARRYAGSMNKVTNWLGSWN